jgi:hypothetical protein
MVKASLELWSSYLCLLCSWHDRQLHHAWLICWDEILLTFYLGWPRATISLILTSQVAGITGMSHCILLLA